MKSEPSSDSGPATPDGAELVSVPLSRRQFIRAAGIAAASPVILGGEPAASASAADGTPEQIHLTWGEDPTQSVCVSWASPGRALHPRAILERTAGQALVVPAQERSYTDGINGQIVFTYHARLEGLAPGAAYHYRVTADNDRRGGEPFAGSFRTAARGRQAFRFTSFGDLATPVSSWVLSSAQSRHAVDAVERFQPLFHLLNGDLCYANLNPLHQPAVWADFGNNVQRSAAFRPWMPCPGNHEVEFGNGEHGLSSYLTRYCLPHNGGAFAGHWYHFRVGSVLFISLVANDVVYQDSGAYNAGPAPLLRATGEPIAAGTSLYVRGYSGGEQTRWLERTLAGAAGDAGIDWIIVQMHQDAMSSSQDGNGSDLGIRESWLPLFDRYGVDLVLCGHDHDYERSWPVRGSEHHVGRDALTGAVVDTRRPVPVITREPTDRRFDTRSGTIHLILGGGGTSNPLDVYGVSPHGTPQAKVITRANHAVAGATTGVFVKPGADAREDAVWSARRDALSGYGIAVFDVDPDSGEGRTAITMNYHHAVGADHAASADYELFDTVILEKARRDR